MRIIAIICFGLSLTQAFAFDASDLKTGDVLLQSVPCYICKLIEIEESAPYSHVGIVAKNGSNIKVLQSWQKVEALTLQSSLALRTNHTATLVLRAIDARGNEIQFNNNRVNTLFYSNYNGLSYDDAFLWDNSDSLGEKLYCSEFAAKFIDQFLLNPIPTKPMHFNAFRSDWVSYFKGNVPDGRPGVSPADFYFSPLFKKVGELPAN